MARWTGFAIAGAVAAGVAGVLGATASCSQTPTNIPVQTFDRPKNVDVVCLQVRDGLNGTFLVPPIPQPQAQCAPVATGVDGTTLPYHLFALVTQTTHGEVAVVDLTGGAVVDVNPSVPGINFLPVGELPSDVTVAPDGKMAFVGSAAPNKPAIYAMPTTVILGGAFGAAYTNDPTQPATIPTLATWPVCALPQAPGSVSVVPSRAAGDGGAADPSSYLLSVVFPGGGGNPARVALVDPRPLERGAGLATSSSAADADGGDAGVASDAGDAVVAPGSLAPCTIVSYTDLAAPAADTKWTLGPAWSDGVVWADGGQALDLPASVTSCATPYDGGVGEAGAPLPGLATTPFAGSAALDLAGSAPILYVADTQLSIIHVLDLSDPTHVVERDPLLATSAQNPDRPVSVGTIAVSPSTRDYKRFLYAIDRNEGSVLLWDVTDPLHGPRTPLRRPHPELAPFQPPDRLLFTAPAASIAFVRHDWPVQTSGNEGASAGVLCNPNPTVPDNTAPALYRPNTTNPSAPALLIGPQRLRGIFAFVTLSNGQVITLDVDDWDAPCRRPDPLAPAGAAEATSATSSTPLSSFLTGPYSSITPPQPPSTDDDPYHAPICFRSGVDTASPVTLEAFAPVSAPHRPRSMNFLRADPTLGNHAPYLLGQPQLQYNGAPLPALSAAGTTNPNLVATDTRFVDPGLQTNPSAPDPLSRTFALTSSDGGAGPTPRDQSGPDAPSDVRFAFEDPLAHVDQDWAVTYEGSLPGFFDSNGNPQIVANLSSTDDYETLTFSSGSARFCASGLEDYALGQQRAAAQAAAMSAVGITPPTRLDHRIGDYVVVVDGLLSTDDPYWGLDNACWADLGVASGGDRRALCASTFGETLDPTNPSQSRDFPILEAYDDHLVVGRYGYAPPAPREVVTADPSNKPFLRLLQCCFHNQAGFGVRTGATWTVVGGAVGFLNHEVPSAPAGRCAPSCEPREALLNGRAPMVPRPPSGGGTPSFSIDRDSPLAFRNPMFSFIVWDGASVTAPFADAAPLRDYVWHFSTRGQLVPQQINLAATTIVVSPQSMRFIDSLGQLAVVDGASQGLILIDLNTVAPSHAPYF